MEDEESLHGALSTVDQFKRNPCLELNLMKTCSLNIGEVKSTSDLAGGLKWQESIQILGITFIKENSDENDFELNFSPCIQKMEDICADWLRRKILLKGKVVLINTLTTNAPCCLFLPKFS